MSHFQDMPNLYALAGNAAPRIGPTDVPAMVVATQPSWGLQPWYEPRREFVLAQEVLQGCFGDYTPQNLEQEHNICLRIPITKEPELPDLDFGQWQHDVDLLLTSLGHEPMTLVPSLEIPSSQQRKRCT
jgi:hypothetical protein